MTYLQPNKKNKVNVLLLVVLSGMLAVGSMYLIILYNRFVNLEHATAGAKASLSAAETQKTDIQNKMFALFDASKSESLASGRLIQEKAPEYFEVQWSYASGY